MKIIKLKVIPNTKRDLIFEKENIKHTLNSSHQEQS